MCLDSIDSFEFILSSGKPYLIVDYYEIVQNPDNMKDVCKFVDIDYKRAVKAVKPELRRSQGISCEYIEYLEEIYRLAGQNEMRDIISLKSLIKSIIYGHIFTKRPEA